MYDEVLKLISTKITIDEFGDTKEEYEAREVFAKAKSVGMSEKYQALAVGLEPELTFVLADYYDYENEKYVEYEGNRYTIIRTYRKETNEIELVVSRVGDTE